MGYRQSGHKPKLVQNEIREGLAPIDPERTAHDSWSTRPWPTLELLRGHFVKDVTEAHLIVGLTSRSAFWRESRQQCDEWLQ
jgi:hypothetical protein